MNIQHLVVKYFAVQPESIDPARFIPLFHQWVADQSMEELLIDVADYRHVPHGPSVLLVGHEADYVLDEGGGRPGLAYLRKSPVAGSNADRFRQALAAAGRAADRVEAELSGVAFDRTEFQLAINDRALAANDADTFAAASSELEEFLKRQFGQDDAAITYVSGDDPRRLLTMQVKLSEALLLAH